MYKKLEVSRSVSILFYYCLHPAPTRNIASYGPASWQIELCTPNTGSPNEQTIARNPTLSYTRCQEVLNFLDNRTQLLGITFGTTVLYQIPVTKTKFRQETRDDRIRHRLINNRKTKIVNLLGAGHGGRVPGSLHVPGHRSCCLKKRAKYRSQDVVVPRKPFTRVDDVTYKITVIRLILSAIFTILSSLSGENCQKS